MNYFEILPNEILEHIFQFFSFSYLFLLKNVCQDWKKIINIPHLDQRKKKSFYSLVQDFISRDDFDNLGFHFVFLTCSEVHFFENCAMYGFLNLIIWMNENQKRRITTKFGNKSVIKKCSINKYSCAVACLNNFPKCLKYLFENGFPLRNIQECFDYAAAGGSIECIKFLIEKGFIWTKPPFRSAAEKGKIHVLKYLRDSGYSWDKWTCYYAITSAQFECLKYLRENNCPWDEEIVQRVFTSDEIKEWILSQLRKQN